MTSSPRWPRLAAAALLFAVTASPAHAGWTNPLAVRSATDPTATLSSPAVALGSGSRGAILAERGLADGSTVVAQGTLRRARVGGLADVLPGPLGSGAVSPAGAAAVVVRPPTGPVAHLRNPLAPFDAPLALGTPDVVTDVATNARGDAVVAISSPAADGVVAIVLHPAGGVAVPAVVVSEPGGAGLYDVAIGAAGHVAVAWSRGGVLEARVRDPSGALSPVAQLTPAGTQLHEASIAVDSRGAADVAALASTPPPAGSTVYGMAVIAAHRPAGGAFGAAAVLDAGSQIESLRVVAAGRQSLATWLLTNVAPPPADTSVTRVHAAARRGDGGLRRVTVAAARGGEAVVSSPRPAIAPDGSAVIASGFGGAVHVAQRRAGRRAFPRPRVVSTLSGGRAALPGANATVAAASGGRALVAWSNPDGRLRLSSLLPGTRDRSGRSSPRPPRLRATPAVLDLDTVPATVRATVSCDGPCRVTILFTVRGSSAQRVSVQRVLSRGRRAVLAEPLSPAEERRLRRIPRASIRSVATTVTAANRYGALVRRVQVVRTPPR